MSHKHNGKNRQHKPFPMPRDTDDCGRLLPTTEQHRQLEIEEGNRSLDALAEITDETDTPELWDEVLRNLGVDPATGRGLGS